MLFLFGVVSAIILMQPQTGRYLAIKDNKIQLSKNPVDAIDISFQPTSPRSISVILSMGSQALYYDEIKKKIQYKGFDNDDKSLFFKVVLIANGSYVLQYEDLCVGGANENFLTLVDCKDENSILHLIKNENSANVIVKSQIIDPVTNRVIEYSDDFEGNYKSKKSKGFAGNPDTEVVKISPINQVSVGYGNGTHLY